MFSRFFIERPIFASVVSIIIVLGGLMAGLALPIEQYPQVTPPNVHIEAIYPGASAEDLAETVAAPLEESINGVENMLYMESTASDSGRLSMDVSFAIGTDPDQAEIDVNNKVQGQISKLPQAVQRQGVTVQSRSASILLVGAMFSPDNSHDKIYISNYALVNVLDDLKRIEGVSNAALFGSQDYSMRVWLNPQKLASYDLTPSDVADAIRSQNSQFAAGKFGDMPTAHGEVPAFTIKATTRGRLSSPEEFKNIILRVNDDGGVLRLGDVARVELGSQSYNIDGSYNGKTAVPFGVFLTPNANSLEVAKKVKATMKSLSKQFPEGVSYSIPYDTTIFVNASLKEVVHTFVVALILVVLLVFLFLQSFRATLIPLLAIPISVIGTFMGMWLLGFSINLLTLFGLILAIGIVVDDAIIVIENVERIMSEDGKSPREASIQAMREVGGPVIAVVLVLAAVFVPVGFLGGLSGQLYSQFAITIAVAVAVSGWVALTLTPALCAVFLKPTGEPAWPFRKFNAGFAKLTNGYVKMTDLLLRRVVIGLALFAVLMGATWGIASNVSSTLMPDEDQGSVFGVVSMPAASSLPRTNEVRDKLINQSRKAFPEIDNIIAFSGYDFLSSAISSDAAVAFISLKPWDERDKSSFDIANGLMGLGMGIPEGQIFAFNPPPIIGLSQTGGFTGYITNKSGADYNQILKDVNKVLAAANKRPELANVRTTLDTGMPRYNIEVNRVKASQLGVPVDDIFSTLQATFGSLYVNDFTLLGRNFQVNLQSEYDFRSHPDDLRHVFVRSNKTGDMIPISTLVTPHREVGPSIVQRFNIFPAAKIMGDPAPGYSSNDALKAMDQVVAEQLGNDYELGWTGQSYFEKRAGAKAAIAIGFGMVMVLLVLAALYERITLPLSVLSAVPFALFGGFLAVWMRGVEQSIYFQVGILVLIGLAAKNAILIIEFAVLEREEGKSYHEAALNAVKLRFRPIVMTSMAFILGVVPLALASGASAASRQAIGTVVIGGMLAATILATTFVPLFYELTERLSDKITGRERKKKAEADAQEKQKPEIEDESDSDNFHG